MRLTRGHLLLVFGVVAGASGFAVIVVPDAVPSEVLRFRDELDRQLVSRFAAGLAGLVVLAALLRLAAIFRTTAEQVDRSLITPDPPEVVTANGVTDTDQRAGLAYVRAVKQFDSPNQDDRLVAIYGRRAQNVAEVDGDLEGYLRELANVVADTYATSVGCDEATATHAVETGQWTDDRVAAAFLATDPDADVSFTAWERLTAWVAPKRVFRTRVQRVLDEAELYADSYLTYGGEVTRDPDTPTASEPAGTSGGVASQSERPRETERVRPEGGKQAPTHVERGDQQ